MGLDMSSNTTLWKDEVALELNKAVLHSYKQAGVSIVDHFTQADQFIDHLREETKVRGGCPADWVWIVPPQSGSLVSTFHQEMLNYHLSPSFEYQDRLYDTWFRGETRKSFRSVALSILVWSTLYLKMIKRRKSCAVYYSSETGTAKHFAKTVQDTFTLSFNTRLAALDDDTVRSDDDVEIFVVSTYGNGESPEMSRGFTNKLNLMVERAANIKNDKEKKHFAVFGLGSSSYPKFAAYGRHLDTCFDSLGGKRMIQYHTGDDQKDQKGSFNKWLKKVFMVSLQTMDLEPPRGYLESVNTVKNYKWRVSNKNRTKTLVKCLSEIHEVDVDNFRLSQRTHLHSEADEPATLKLDFITDHDYTPGDHLTVFPSNDQNKIKSLKTRLINNPPDDKPVTLQCQTRGLWETVEDFPTEILFNDLLTSFIDISQVPSQSLLNTFSLFAEDNKDKEELNKLVNHDDEYEKWRLDLKVMYFASAWLMNPCIGCI